MTPSPDKLEIPEAAVEAAFKALPPDASGMIGAGEMDRVLRAALSHMPDRGYAEGIEAAAEKARLWITATDDPCMGRCLELAAAIRTLAAPAPADNRAPERKSYNDAWAVWKKLADHGYLSAGAADTGPQGYQGSVIEIIRGALSVTPSPIEDVAGPGEAEVARVREHKWFSPECAESGCRSLILEHEVERLKELNDKYIWQVRDTCTRAEKAEADLAAAESDTRDEAYREGYEEGKSEWRGVKAQLWNAMQHWLTLRHGLVDTTGEGYTVNDILDGLAEVEAENKRLLLSARRVRPSPVDEDARALGQAAADLIASRSDSFKARNGRDVGIQDDAGEKMWIVPFDEMAALEAALQSQRKG